MFYCLRFSQAVKFERKINKQPCLWVVIYALTVVLFLVLEKIGYIYKKKGYSTLKSYLTQKFWEYTHTVESSLCKAVSKSFIQNFIKTFNIEFINECDNDYWFGTLAFLSLPDTV